MDNFKVGQLYKFNDDEELYFKIISISPKKDYEGDITYFVEFNNLTLIWYGILFEVNLEQAILVDEVN